jgi:HK97 family phage major capsid protein
MRLASQDLNHMSDDFRTTRAALFSAYETLGRKANPTVKELVTFKKLGAEIDNLDAAFAADSRSGYRQYASAASDPYTSDTAAQAAGLSTSKGLAVGGLARLLAAAGSNPMVAAAHAEKHLGARHPITVVAQKALLAGSGASGGFIVPPDQALEIIELLRPRAVVRNGNPRTMGMPRGTMTLPAQTSAASASYGGETQQIPASQQSLGQIVASYKKLTALVPIGNDLMRYADPAADAFVRDDLVKVIVLREDISFMLSDGTVNQPQGFLSFANSYSAANGGTVFRYGVAAATGVSSALGWTVASSSNATAAGNIINSTNSAITLANTVAELGKMVNLLDAANVPDIRRRWFFHPRIYNYLYNLLNSLGLYVYRDELDRGVLLGYPFSKSTQIPVNIVDPTGAYTNGSFIFLVEMDDALVLDSMRLELAVSREGAYYDTNGVLQLAFQNDQTIIRAIAEHDFQMRHIASVAVDQFVGWDPSNI